MGKKIAARMPIRKPSIRTPPGEMPGGWGTWPGLDVSPRGRPTTVAPRGVAAKKAKKKR